MSARPHNLLIVGLGPAGRRHLRAFEATARVQPTVCDADADTESRLAVMRDHSVDRAYASLDEALTERHDVAVVTGPVPQRFATAVRLMEHRIHVLMDPPLGTTLSGSDEMLAMARRMRRVAATGYTWRAHPALLAMRAAMREGRFGRPLQVIGVDARRPAGSDHTPSSLEPVSHKTGGGVIQQGLSRLMNAAQWLVGSMDYLIADAERQMVDPAAVEDTVHVIARHGHVMAEYAANQHQSIPETFLTVVAEGGCCRFDLLHNRWGWQAGGGSSWQFERFPLEEPSDTIELLRRRQAEAFLDAVEGIRPPLCTLEEGVETLRMTLAALESARTHARKPIEAGHGVGWG